MQRIEKELDSSFISPASFSIQVAYPLSQATRLRSGCREKCPPLATAAAATTTHTAATNTRSQVKPGTNASARGLRETTLNAGTYVHLTTSVGAPTRELEPQPGDPAMHGLQGGGCATGLWPEAVILPILIE